MNQKKNAIIVGGGAAGFFCAANLDENFYSVQIVEQAGEVLQKVKISGGGRCNVSHACFDPKELSAFYPRGNKELISVFTKFQPGDTMAWFENKGVELKIEADNRIFPTTNSSQSIINALVSEVKKKGFQIRTKVLVKEIIKEEKGFRVITNAETLFAEIIIFTPGSVPKSAKILENLGHTMVSPVPSLFSFNIKDTLLDGLAGTTFSQAEIKIPELKTEESGALLITHWGLSGPAILKISAWEARRLAERKYHFNIEVNFISKSFEEAEKDFKKYRETHPKKSLAAVRIFDLTQRFWSRILEVSSVNPEKQLANITAEEQLRLITNLCKKTFAVHGKSTFKEEFVTAGGVSLKEINFKNMESKRIANFFIAGEALDIDAVTGGFNFQACWSEAWLIAEYLNSKFSEMY